MPSDARHGIPHSVSPRPGSPRLGGPRPGSTRPYARGPKRPSTPATRSADMMSEVLARLGGTGRGLEFRVFDCYSRVVGATFRARSMPERLTGTTLFVRVASSALAHELTLLRAEVLARMEKELGYGVIVELRTRVGRIPSSI